LSCLFVGSASGCRVQICGSCAIIHPWCVVRGGAEVYPWLHCSYRVAFRWRVRSRCWEVTCIYVTVYGQLVTTHKGTESFESTSNPSQFLRLCRVTDQRFKEIRTQRCFNAAAGFWFQSGENFWLNNEGCCMNIRPALGHQFWISHTRPVPRNHWNKRHIHVLSLVKNVSGYKPCFKFGGPANPTRVLKFYSALLDKYREIQE
jgi:hypothetical protein